jgi:septal ring factor EnvC (AmiA/AmiB activator)
MSKSSLVKTSVIAFSSYLVCPLVVYADCQLDNKQWQVDRERQNLQRKCTCLEEKRDNLQHQIGEFERQIVRVSQNCRDAWSCLDDVDFELDKVKKQLRSSDTVPRSE